jgi:CRP-like cAMP-binding protein
MEDLLKLEQLVDQQVQQNDEKAAVTTLHGLIVRYVKAKNFKKADSLRERLIEIAPLALTEIIRSAEIIEQEKKKGIAQDHLDVWADLYGSLTTEEGNALYYAMKEVSCYEEEPIYTQGERNTNLYFIRQGQLKMLYNAGGKEGVLKMLRPGDVVGEETFFADSVCTTTVVPLSRVKASYLEQHVLLEWKAKFPALESKLYGYCLKFEKADALLAKKGLDRRVEKRFRINGKAIIQILNVSGAPVGNPFKVGLSDLSATGISCLVRLAKREAGRLLLGRDMSLKLMIVTGKDTRTISQNGTVVAVRSNPFDEHSLHIKFHKILENSLVSELARIGSHPSP